jgi:hypothetical protein
VKVYENENHGNAHSSLLLCAARQRRALAEVERREGAHHRRVLLRCWEALTSYASDRRRKTRNLGRARRLWAQREARRSLDKLRQAAALGKARRWRHDMLQWRVGRALLTLRLVAEGRRRRRDALAMRVMLRRWGARVAARKARTLAGETLGALTLARTKRRVLKAWEDAWRSKFEMSRSAARVSGVEEKPLN